MIPSFQRSHFFPTANFFPGLSKFQQPIFFNSIILRFPAVTFLSWPLYNFFPTNFFFLGQIQRLFQTAYQFFFFFKRTCQISFPGLYHFFPANFFFFWSNSTTIPNKLPNTYTHIEPVKYIHT